MKNTQQYQDVKNHAIMMLRDGVGTGDSGELHHKLFNEDYFIIGTFQAKQWLGSEVFDAIETIKEYEQDNFGEVTTDFSNPEKVANMLAYVLGEQILGESETLLNKWNEQLEELDLLAIAEELEA
jgi:hypothetical protein